MEFVIIPILSFSKLRELQLKIPSYEQKDRDRKIEKVYKSNNLKAKLKH